jgi:hypothetical protein
VVLVAGGVVFVVAGAGELAGSGTGGLVLRDPTPARLTPFALAGAAPEPAISASRESRSAADRIRIPRHCSQAFGGRIAPFATVTPDP